MTENSDINTHLAQRISELRASAGLSLDALASRCEVSRSMISLIERGETSPTAAVLAKIATGLGVTLASLFEDSSAKPNPVVHDADRRLWRDPDSGYIRRNISPPNFPSPIQIVEVEIPPGVTVAYESAEQQRAIHEQIWVQDGKLNVTCDDHTFKLNQGDCLAIQLNEATAFHNPSGKKTHYLVIIANEFPVHSR